MNTNDIFMGLKAIALLMLEIFITVINVLAGIAKAFISLLSGLK